MDRVCLDTISSPDIRIGIIEGNLRIKGWDRPEIRADSSTADTLSVESEDEAVLISCKSGCILRIPVESTITIEEVRGELMLKSLECKVEAQKVAGNVMAKSVGPLTFSSINGNLNVRYLEGNLVCENVEGNANVRDIEGNITISNATRSLTFRGYSSSISAYTKANASLRLDPKSGGEYSIKADGNIHCQLVPDTNATIHLKSNSENINVNAFGTKDLIKEKEFQFDVGDGDSNIVLEANGNVDLIAPLEHETDWGFGFDFDENITSIAEDISQVVTDQIEQQMDVLTKHLDELTSQVHSTRVEEKTRRKLESKRQALERKLARVEKRAVQRARGLERRKSAAARRFGYGKKSASDPVTDQERQKVLEMLQNQQISVTEAETLLSALEGKTPEIPEE
jgi:hypothetical protein